MSSGVDGKWLRRYQQLWRVLWLPVCAVELLVGAIAIPDTCLGFMAIAALIAGFVRFVLDQDTTSEPVCVDCPERSDTLRRSMRSAAAGAGCAGAFVGAAVTFEGTVFAVALLFAASSPLMLRLACRWWQRTLASPEVHWTSAVSALACAGGDCAAAYYWGVEQLTDEQLCEAWGQTCAALDEATQSSTVSRIVRERTVYVEEMARRNPDGITEWLAAGPATVRDPSPFLACREASEGIDWDGLLPGQDH